MKTFAISCSCVAMLLAGSAASASPLTWAQVGALDKLIAGGSATLPAGDLAARKSWVADVLAIPAADLHVAPIAGNEWHPVEDTDSVFALDLGDTPSWFVVETGTGDETTNFLVENLEDQDTATLDFDDLGDGLEIAGVIGVSLSGDTRAAAAVPEPASLALFSAGLVVVASRRLRQRRAAAR